MRSTHQSTRVKYDQMGQCPTYVSMLIIACVMFICYDSVNTAQTNNSEHRLDEVTGTDMQEGPRRHIGSHPSYTGEPRYGAAVDTLLLDARRHTVAEVVCIAGQNDGWCEIDEYFIFSIDSMTILTLPMYELGWCISPPLCELCIDYIYYRTSGCLEYARDGNPTCLYYVRTTDRVIFINRQRSMFDIVYYRRIYVELRVILLHLTILQTGLCVISSRDPPVSGGSDTEASDLHAVHWGSIDNASRPRGLYAKVCKWGPNAFSGDWPYGDRGSRNCRDIMLCYNLICKICTIFAGIGIWHHYLLNPNWVRVPYVSNACIQTMNDGYSGHIRYDQCRSTRNYQNKTLVCQLCFKCTHYRICQCGYFLTRTTGRIDVINCHRKISICVRYAYYENHPCSYYTLTADRVIFIMCHMSILEPDWCQRTIRELNVILLPLAILQKDLSDTSSRDPPVPGGSDTWATDLHIVHWGSIDSTIRPQGLYVEVCKWGPNALCGDWPYGDRGSHNSRVIILCCELIYKMCIMYVSKCKWHRYLSNFVCVKISHLRDPMNNEQYGYNSYVNLVQSCIWRMLTMPLLSRCNTRQEVYRSAYANINDVECLLRECILLPPLILIGYFLSMLQEPLTKSCKPDMRCGWDLVNGDPLAPLTTAWRACGEKNTSDVCPLTTLVDGGGDRGRTNANRLLRHQGPSGGEVGHVRPATVLYGPLMGMMMCQQYCETYDFNIWVNINPCTMLNELENVTTSIDSPSRSMKAANERMSDTNENCDDIKMSFICDHGLLNLLFKILLKLNQYAYHYCCNLYGIMKLTILSIVQLQYRCNDETYRVMTDDPGMRRIHPPPLRTTLELTDSERHRITSPYSWCCHDMIRLDSSPHHKGYSSALGEQRRRCGVKNGRDYSCKAVHVLTMLECSTSDKYNASIFGACNATYSRVIFIIDGYVRNELMYKCMLTYLILTGGGIPDEVNNSVKMAKEVNDITYLVRCDGINLPMRAEYRLSYMISCTKACFVIIYSRTRICQDNKMR